jgi:hypothetical protein
VSPAEAQEVPLQVAARPVSGDLAQGKSEHLRLSGGSPDQVGWDDRGQVGDRAAWGRDRDPSVPGRDAGRCSGRQRGTAVQAYPGPIPPPISRRDGDIDRSLEGPQQSPQSRGAPVTENGAVAKRKDSCHPAARVGQTWITHCVHAPMNPVEKPRANPPANRIVADSCLSQLPDRDNPMLTSGDFRHPPVSRVDFSVHSTDKSTRAPVRPSTAAGSGKGPGTRI